MVLFSPRYKNQVPYNQLKDLEEIKSGNFGTVYRAKWVFVVPPDSLGDATLSTRLYDGSDTGLNELDDEEDDEKVYEVAIKFPRSDRPNWRNPDKVNLLHRGCYYSAAGFSKVSYFPEQIQMERLE